ncbi:MAG: type II toxin-antitoxin system VapC family toxin [Spirochaetales bacterium]|jgi:uncharacterized protein|nr:type II toxin-antitoxin system VapC family toxin [Spirochaetales bacterium]
MTYWDSSCLVALLVEETNTVECESRLRSDPQIVTWWLSRIECVSALNRLCRNGNLTESELRVALKNLEILSDSFVEVQPVAAVRLIAARLLRVHPLRAADSLQLASAVLAAGENRKALEFLSYDTRLAEAADREGFACL